ncbi:hypothetical protein EI94DRAFT_1750635 [Lactarius quietus]|nr:hypothetical protein EI94DRAFT_1750635 [Lactarius quietus]
MNSTSRGGERRGSGVPLAGARAADVLCTSFSRSSRASYCLPPLCRRQEWCNSSKLMPSDHSVSYARLIPSATSMHTSSHSSQRIILVADLVGHIAVTYFHRTLFESSVSSEQGGLNTFTVSISNRSRFRDHISRGPVGVEGRLDNLPAWFQKTRQGR